jgi:hypothetical protein
MVQFAEAVLTMAEADLQSALHLSERVPGSVSEIELERLRWEVKLSQLGLEKARQLSRTGSPEAKIEWRLQQLQNQLFRLQILAQDIVMSSH